MKAGIFFTMAGSWVVALKKLNINIEWHYCIKEFHEIFSLNFPEVLITDKLNEINSGLDLVVGSPPCIGMSQGSRASEKLKTKGARLDHPANQETIRFAMVVEVIRPKGFIMEMVPGLLTNKKFRPLLDTYLKILNKNYNVIYEQINFLDYGTPQRRKRAIILGIQKKYNICPSMPPSTHSKYTTLRQAFKGLPKLTEKEAIEKNLNKKFDIMNKGPFSMYRGQSVNPFLEWDSHAPTITAISAPFLIHPSRQRTITWQEASRLMEYPDTFQFIGTVNKKFKYVAWGVPCKGIQPFIQKIMEYIK